MYDPSLYDYDSSHGKHEASLRTGAYLYRLASINHCDQNQILSGRGTLVSRSFGRFNCPQQLTTYCANNVLVCISEVLFHMYRATLRGIQNKAPSAAITACTVSERMLAVSNVKEIENLVFLDSDNVIFDYDKRICGATTVFPEPVYDVFHDFNNQMRAIGKKGIIYPSARHSQDFCIALFDDETSSIKAHRSDLHLTLHLISEDQDVAGPIARCNPLKQKLHATMGYYAFSSPDDLKSVLATQLLNPRDLPPCGMVDFVRRHYQKYPTHAVRPS